MPLNYTHFPFAPESCPPGWREIALAEVIDSAQTGYSSGRHNKDGEGIPHLRPMNVTPVGEISLDDVRYVSPDAGGSRLQAGDVLFTNTSSTVWVGKTALVTSAADWGFSNHMTRLRVIGILPEFVSRQLHFLCLAGYFAFHCKKHVNQSSISTQQLLTEVPIRIAPRAEQERIIEKLDQLLREERNLVHQFAAVPPLLRDCRTALLQAAFTGKLKISRRAKSTSSPAKLLASILTQRERLWNRRRPESSGRPRPGKKAYPVPTPPPSTGRPPVPRSWTCVSLDQITDPRRPICYGILMPKGDVPDGVPLVKVRDIRDDAIQVEGLQRTSRAIAEAYHRSTLQAGDIVLSIRGTYGRVATVPRELAGGNITQDTVRIAPLAAVDRRYLAWYLRSPYAQDYFESVAKGVAVRGVNVSDVRAMPMPLPSLAEQRRLVAEIGRRMKFLSHLESQIANVESELASLRLSLLRDAFSGQMTPRLADDEPAVDLLARIQAERAAKLAAGNDKPKRTMKPSGKLPVEKRPLLDVLAEHERGISPEKLLESAGYSAEEIPLFYKALRAIEGKVREERPEAKRVLLKLK